MSNNVIEIEREQIDAANFDADIWALEQYGREIKDSKDKVIENRKKDKKVTPFSIVAHMKEMGAHEWHLTMEEIEGRVAPFSRTMYDPRGILRGKVEELLCDDPKKILRVGI